MVRAVPLALACRAVCVFLSHHAPCLWYGCLVASCRVAAAVPCSSFCCVSTTDASECNAARPTKIQHWQLRDLVHCEDDEHVFCVSDRCTVLYDTRNNQAGASPRGVWGCSESLLVCYA